MHWYDSHLEFQLFIIQFNKQRLSLSLCIICWLVNIEKRKWFALIKTREVNCWLSTKRTVKNAKKMSQIFYESIALELFQFFSSDFTMKSNQSDSICVNFMCKNYLQTPPIGNSSGWMRKKDSKKVCCTTPSCKTGRLLRDFVLLFLFNAVCILSLKDQLFSAGATQTTHFSMLQ